MTEHQLIAALRRRLADTGLVGSFLVRELPGGAEIGIDPDVEFPAASLVKLPQALAVLARITAGQLDGAATVTVEPKTKPAPMATGLGQFRHPSRIAVEDLLYLSLAISDNTAADALFDLVPPAEVQRALHEIGIARIAVRHRLRELVDTPAADDIGIAQALAIGSGTRGRGHAMRQLDVSRANSGTARAFVDLLEALWFPRRVNDRVAARLRELLAANVIRHRLTPDFAADAARWSSKTGTLLNLRHEVGVVEHEDGTVFAVAALTESTVPAAIQPAADATMAHVARALHDHLRNQ